MIVSVPPDAIEEGPPGCEAVFEPRLLGGNIVFLIEGGVADHGTGPEPGDQIEDPAEAVQGHLPDPGIERPRTQVHERGVKGHRKTRIGEPFRRLPEISLMKTVKIWWLKPISGIDPLPDYPWQTFPGGGGRAHEPGFFAESPACGSHRRSAGALRLPQATRFHNRQFR